jgi:hypothetical protein
MDHNRRKPIQVAGEKVIISEIVCSEATKNPKMQHFNDQISDGQYRAMEQSWLSYVQGEREKEGMEHLADTNAPTGRPPAIQRRLTNCVTSSADPTHTDNNNTSHIVG